MINKLSYISTGLCGFAWLLAFSAPAHADEDVYAGFPVTLKGYSGSAKDSVSYKGQIARHVLHDSLKKLAGSGNGSADPALKAKMLAYFEGTEPGRAILAPVSNGPFVIEQAMVDDISKGRELASKTYKGAIAGWPNNMTGPEVVAFWIDKAAAADKGFDMANGYSYAQLISKFVMGAVFYNQVVDGYLDENLSADKKPNNEPYGKGAAYTGKEHSWDEAFGYFGTPAHTLKLTAGDIYDINKLGGKNPEATLAKADYNKDGKVDLYREMAFGPAYYAAGFDASVYDTGNGTTYLHTITRAFLDGRKLLVAANGEKLTDAQRSKLREYAATIESNWEKVLAEAAFKYAGSVYKDVDKLQTILEAKGDTATVLRDYVNHWGELKGFSLSLQAGRKNLGETSVVLNRLIGFGPVMPNLSQVIDVDSNGNYVKGEAVSLDEYKLHMLKVQKLMVDEFGVRARNNDVMAGMAGLAKKLGSGKSAEND
ncbi:MAG: DUF4856 domain-containing protein [Alphaproteobacteria bacterium]